VKLTTTKEINAAPKTPGLIATAIKVALKTPGRYGLGDGLELEVQDGGKAYWVYHYMNANGKRPRMSLGPYRNMSLAEARIARDAERIKLKNEKIDPLVSRRAAKQTRAGKPTFGEMADEHLRAHQPSRANEGHRRQWFVGLTKYCAPIRNMSVDEIKTADVRLVLEPVWRRAPDTGVRLRGMIEKVLAFAQAEGHIDEDRVNPAIWSRLKDGLPDPDDLAKRLGKRRHQPAMPYADVPAFIAKLKGAEGIAVEAFMLAILTAARTNEVTGATWDEIDLDAARWTVPAERMKKTHAEHVVPLSDAAVELLRGQLATRRPKQAHVFPGARPGKPLSDAALAQTLRRMGGREYTVHGFRSAFRDWAGDHGVDFEVAENCLAHVVSNKVTRAYLRTTMVARRRMVMADWDAFLLAGESDEAKVESDEAKVVSIRSLRGKRRLRSAAQEGSA
jgi:integrase